MKIVKDIVIDLLKILVVPLGHISILFFAFVLMFAFFSKVNRTYATTPIKAKTENFELLCEEIKGEFGENIEEGNYLCYKVKSYEK